LRFSFGNRTLTAPKYDGKFFERRGSTAETRGPGSEPGQVFASQIEAEITTIF